MKALIYLLIVVFGLSACSESVESVWKDTNIALFAEVNGIGSSRNVYKGESVANMEAAVWFSTISGEYPDNDAPEAPTYLPYRANVKYAADGPTTINVGNTNNVLAYPTDNQTGVYCVGFYPQTGWTSNDNKIAKHDITGTDDVMFALEKYGTWQEPFETQTYNHLLTWLTFVVHATDVDAAASWGNIQKFALVSPHSEVQITLKEGTIEYVGAPREMSVVATDTPLSVVADPLGDVLCAPATSYTLKIKTVGGGEKEIQVTLNNENGEALTDYKDAVGRQFIVNLCFTSFNDINAMCSLIPWNEENVDLN